MKPAAPQETRSRYPGTRPFSDSAEDVAKFFGRGEEIEEIHLRVLSVPLLVQFGRSGLGKTSLLQAGLFPRLRQKPFLPVMVRFNIEEESLMAAVTRSIRESCVAEGLEFSAPEAPGLWELLSDITVWRGDLLLTPVLVFDQFEEVFTLRDAAFRDELSAELGALATGIRPPRVKNPALAATPDVKIVISLREDYLGSLEEFSAAIPGLFHERLRLEALRESSARAAIVQPADLPDVEGAPYDSPRFDFEPAALDAMLAYLKGHSGVIEPFQLQLLSRHAEKIATEKSQSRAKVTLTLADFNEGRDFPAVMKHFYRDTLRELDPPSQRRRAQMLCEEGLIGADGHRLMLEERQIRGDYGVAQPTLDTLCDERLLRREKRQESVFYEISHDRLAASIRDARRFRVPAKLRRVLWVAAVASLLIVGLLVFYNYRVQNERDSAERMLSFLLGEDFLGEVRDSGRTSLLELVQDQIDDKDDHLSAVNQGLAIRNRGDIKRNAGLLSASILDFREALKHFNDTSRDPNVVREAARTHERLGDALTAQGRITEAREQRDAAVAAWRSVLAKPGAAITDETVDDCTDLAMSLLSSSELRARLGDMKGALTALHSGYAIASNLLFGAHGGECGSVVAFLDPYPNPGVLEVLGRVTSVRAQLLNFEGDYQATAILLQRTRELAPTSASVRRDALIARALHIFTRSDSGRNDTMPESRAVLREFNELGRWDPRNRTWQFDRARTQSLMVLAAVICQQNPTCEPKPSLDDTLAMSLEAQAVLRGLASIDRSDSLIEGYWLWAMERHADVLRARKDDAGALATLEEAERRYAASVVVHEPNDFELAVDRRRRIRTQAGLLLTLHRIPEAKKKIQEARAIRLPDSDVPTHLLSLRAVRDLEAKILEAAGDSYGAANAAAEAAPLQQRYDAITSKHSINDTTAVRSYVVLADRGMERFQADRYEEAMKEFVAARSVARDIARLNPGHYASYGNLRDINDWIQWTSHLLKRDDQRLTDLRAAVYAGQIAAWLAPPEAQKDMTARLLAVRNNLTGYLAGPGDATQDALAMANEVVAVAEGLVQDPQPEPRFVSALGVAKCSQGRLRKELNVIGWEEALRTALIYIRRAEAAGFQEWEAAKDWGTCRVFFADQLAKTNPTEAADRYESAARNYALASSLAPWDEETKHAESEARRKARALRP